MSVLLQSPSVMLVDQHARLLNVSEVGYLLTALVNSIESKPSKKEPFVVALRPFQSDAFIGLLGSVNRATIYDDLREFLLALSAEVIAPNERAFFSPGPLPYRDAVLTRRTLIRGPEAFMGWLRGAKQRVALRTSEWIEAADGGSPTWAELRDRRIKGDPDGVRLWSGLIAPRKGELTLMYSNSDEVIGTYFGVFISPRDLPGLGMNDLPLSLDGAVFLTQNVFREGESAASWAARQLSNDLIVTSFRGVASVGGNASAIPSVVSIATDGAYQMFLMYKMPTGRLGVAVGDKYIFKTRMEANGFIPLVYERAVILGTPEQDAKVLETELPFDVRLTIRAAVHVLTTVARHFGFDSSFTVEDVRRHAVDFLGAVVPVPANYAGVLSFIPGSLLVRKRTIDDLLEDLTRRLNDGSVTDTTKALADILRLTTARRVYQWMDDFLLYTVIPISEGATDVAVELHRYLSVRYPEHFLHAISGVDPSDGVYGEGPDYFAAFPRLNYSRTHASSGAKLLWKSVETAGGTVPPS